MAAKKISEEIKNVAEELLDAAKAPAKKTTRKRTTKKTVKVSVNLEFQGGQHDITDVAKKAEQAFKESHPEVVIETLDVYCKPEEGVAYYVVNGEGSESFKVEI